MEIWYMPKSLIHNKRFKVLCAESKLLYTVIHNQVFLFDCEAEISERYFEYSKKRIQDELCFSSRKIKAYMQELIDVGLIKIVSSNSSDMFEGYIKDADRFIL